MSITVQLIRQKALINNSHLFSMTIDDVDYAGVTFGQALGLMSSALQARPEEELVLLRGVEGNALTQYVDIPPSLRVLIRDDPAAAVRALDAPLGAPVSAPSKPLIRSHFETMAAAFGERVFLRMQNGYVQDPYSGTWKSLAYVRGVWAIRGDANAYKEWLPIKLEDVPYDTPLADLPPEDMQATLEQGAADLAACQWASCAVQDMLDANKHEYYLPHEWAGNENWVSWDRLNQLYADFIEEKEKAES